MRQAAELVLAAARRCSEGRVPIVAVSGVQGAGKSTLARALAAASQGAMAQFSLDDVYLGKQERRDLAAGVHPLLATRGPPGTHDLALLESALQNLLAAGPASVTPLPAFDKGQDDRLPESLWPRFAGQPEIILLEGWCLGALPQSPSDLSEPVNDLEAREDRDGVWRGYVNAQLGADYLRVFSGFDAILHLRAPDFSVTPLWRRQQEEVRVGRPLTPGEDEALLRFVSHFERISRHMLSGGRRAEVEVDLDASRRPLAVRSLDRDRL
ncbi:MAG: kinase [Alphaproteobacteria bacterium]|nr:kinase [Alphaproteobacteria bacterium]